jgi:hypothetical protein
MLSCPAGSTMCADGCRFQHITRPFVEMALCMRGSGCPPPAVVAQAFNRTCPDWGQLPLAPGFNVSTLAADYGTLYPLRATKYEDCLPCQRVVYDPANSNAVTAHWTQFGGGSCNSSSEDKNVSYSVLQNGEGQGVGSYSVLGLPLRERVFYLDAIPDFLLLFYCGTVLDGHYLGVYGTKRPPAGALPPEVEARFARVLEAANLSAYIPPLSQFCVPEYPAGCPA